MILVVGATGRLGTAFCDRLRMRGHQARALVRDGSPRATRLFDRLIVAHARLRGWRLATGDPLLLDRLNPGETLSL